MTATRNPRATLAISRTVADPLTIFVGLKGTCHGHMVLAAYGSDIDFRDYTDDTPELETYIHGRRHTIDFKDPAAIRYEQLKLEEKTLMK